MHDVDLVLPTVVFDERLTLYVGNKTLEMWTSPGHSPDSIVCRIKEDQVLFAADTLMPIPYFVDGSFDDFLQSLDKLRNGGFDNIVQGHGEVILRGEVEDKIQSDIDYLHQLRDAVDAALLHPVPDQALERIDIESCGKSRILLNGTVEQLHRQNVVTLANHRREQMQIEYQGE
jgi:glyoxylase-like metal-dependent hydrolase (beta-lactamase superfamily II)